MLLAVHCAWGQIPAGSTSPANTGPNSQSGSTSGNGSGGSGDASGGSGTAFVATQGGDFSGSVPSPAVPGVLQVSLQDAIDRGLKQNLGVLISSSDIGTARGQRWEQ